MTACALLACSNKIHMNFVLHASDEHTRPGNEARSSPHNPAHHTINGDTTDLACSVGRVPSHLSFTLFILCSLGFLKSLTSSSTFLSHCHSLVCTLHTSIKKNLYTLKWIYFVHVYQFPDNMSVKISPVPRRKYLCLGMIP